MLHWLAILLILIYIYSNELFCISDSEQGCHFMYVKDQLQKQLKFSKIQPKTVTHCMGLLEKRSIIFSVSSDKHFMLL